MILFQKIKWKNLLSTGNQYTEVILNKDQTTLIIGTNGAGKSTVLDALCFVLYGKSFRKIRKDQLINSTNEKGTVVEIEFNVNGTEWKVVRGIKPNNFEIYKDNEFLDQSHSAIDQQKWLEQNVLKMNYKSFTQIIILGSSSFVPFMQLPSSSRREVVEELLDIKIFSSMNSLIKERIRSHKEEIRTFELSKTSVKDKISMQERFIEEVETTSKSNIKDKEDKIKSILNEENDLMNDNIKLSEELDDFERAIQVYTGASDKLKKLGNIKGKLSQKVSTITKEHKFFTENTVCPTCTQEIEEEFRINKIDDAQNKAKELQSGFIELEKAINDEEDRERQFTSLTKEILTLTHGISKNNTQIAGCQKQIRDLESEIQRVTEQLANRNTEHDKLAELKQKLKSTQDKLSEKREDIFYHDFTYGLLKDGGVKSKIIKKYLPLINQQVNKYLQMMEFYINFTLDSEFNESIESPIHEDFTYSSFSEGEKLRIDLSLLFTWREVSRHKNSVNTNLMILDEICDSSLDGTGNDEFLKIIRYNQPNANVFVISHKEGLEDKFDKILRFEKVKGFSRLSP